MGNEPISVHSLRGSHGERTDIGTFSESEPIRGWFLLFDFEFDF